MRRIYGRGILARLIPAIEEPQSGSCGRRMEKPGAEYLRFGLGSSDFNGDAYFNARQLPPHLAQQPEVNGATMCSSSGTTIQVGVLPAAVPTGTPGADGEYDQYSSGYSVIHTLATTIAALPSAGLAASSPRRIACSVRGPRTFTLNWGLFCTAGRKGGHRRGARPLAHRPA
jgi:hypothetical protein